MIRTMLKSTQSVLKRYLIYQKSKGPKTENMWHRDKTRQVEDVLYLEAAKETSET